MTRLFSLFALLVLLAACQDRASAAAPGNGESCGAARQAGLVGQRLDDVLLPQGQPDGPDVRIVGPDSVVTMDFRSDRLNVATDRDGTIVRVYCG